MTGGSTQARTSGNPSKTCTDNDDNNDNNNNDNNDNNDNNNDNNNDERGLYNGI